MVAVGFGGFFLLVFGGVRALMMLLGLYSLLNSLVVEIRNGKVVTRRSFFLPFKRTARLEDLQRIEMDVHSRVGQGGAFRWATAYLWAGSRRSLQPSSKRR